MKNSRRFFAFASVVFVLLVSIVSQPMAAARKRCPVRIPDGLLTLYLKSDLIVIGSVTSEKFLKKTHEYDHGYTFDTEKKLRVSRTLKGFEKDSAAFVVSNFKSAKAEENNVETDFYAMSAGEEALFFLVKNEDGDSYELADYSSGMKILSVTDAGIYTKFIEELKRITTNKKDQTAELTEWLVRLAEEPLTRGDGTRDLNDSFYALASEQENEAGEKRTEVQKPFVLDENFRAANTSAIAKALNASQKQRLTTALLASISDDLFKLNASENSENAEQIYPDYQSSMLVGHWDKNYLAMSSFAFLLNTDASNSRRIEYLMRIISGFLEDDELYEILNEYDSAMSEPDDAEIDRVEKIEVEEAEVSTENEVASETEESAGENVEEVSIAEDEKPAAETAEKSAAKITYKEHRKKLLAKFVNQYGVVISQGSASN